MKCHNKAEFVFVCTGCGGEARYVGISRKSVCPGGAPVCEACKRARRRKPREHLRWRTQTIRSRPPHPDVADEIVLAEGPVPTVSVPTRLLVMILTTKGPMRRIFETSNGPDSLRDLARVVRRRSDLTVNSYLASQLNYFDPPPCACGKPGLYRIGLRTFCRACRPVNDHGLAYHRNRFDQKSAAIEEKDRAIGQRALRLERDRRRRATGRQRP